MGGSSGQVTGYRYFTNLLLFIGNPIEKMLGINFDKRGWISPFIDENGNALAQGVINSPNLYGENEGGVAGTVHVQYGRDDQEVLPFYKAYMDSKELPASAFPYQSYLAFTGIGVVNNTGLIGGVVGALMPYRNNAFYVGNSGYMKEMLLWPKRIHVRNDGRGQWYDAKSEIPDIQNSTIIENNIQDVAGSKIIVNYDLESSYRGNYTISGTFNISGDGNAYTEVGLKFASSTNYNWTPDQTANQIIYLPPFGKAKILSLQCYTFDILESLVIGPEGVEIISSEEIVPAQSGDGLTQNRQINYEIFIPENVGLVVNAKFRDGIGFWHSLLMRSFFSFTFKSGSFTHIPGGSGDINPIHKIREILTDDTAMNKPESSVNNENFIKAADRIWKEGLGISWSITEKSCIDAINELCYHIEAGIRVNRQTGLYEMVLFRDNWFEESEIHTITESKIKSMQYEITNVDEVINQVNVNFYDRPNIKNSSFSISENGLIQTLGRVNAETVDFPYFMNMRNAEIVANWKLKQLSTGAFKGSFTTGWREARKWNRYDLIRLPWSKRWTGTILVRIMSINLGGPVNNEVSIEFIEVVPATGMMNTTIVIDDPIDTKPQAPQPCNAKVFELPYFEAVQVFGEREVNIELANNPEAGYLCAIAEKPQSNSLNAALHVDSGNSFERVATINYCETAYLDQSIDRMSSSFVVKNVGNIASVRIGSQIFINDEIMVYQSFDAETKVLTVKRGAFGIPQIHAANSILYFADDFVAVEQSLYVQSEIVNAKVLTTTPSGVLDLADAVNYEVEFKAQAVRPYPPANVKINGEYWPLEIETDLILTWVDRNRLQQTGGEIIGWYEGGVTIEPNVTYQLILIERDENEVELHTQNLSLGTLNTYTFATSAMSANTRTIEIILKSLRDGYECSQPFIYTVELSQFFSAPYDLTVEFKND